MKIRETHNCYFIIDVNNNTLFTKNTIMFMLTSVFMRADIKWLTLNPYFLVVNIRPSVVVFKLSLTSRIKMMFFFGTLYPDIHINK